MSRRFTSSLVAIVAVAAAPIVLEGARPAGSKPASAGPKTTASAKGQTARPPKPTTTTKTSSGKSASAKPVNTRKGGSTTTARANAKVTGKNTSTTSTSSSATNGAGSSSTSTTDTSSTSTTTTTNTWKPNNPVAEKLSTKPTLLSKVQGVLPPGTDLNKATAGFKNFGQLIAAANVSKNLGISFADLKAAMTGTTLAGRDTKQPILSLGEAIQKYRNVDSTTAATTASTATTQAESEIATSPTTTSTSSSSATTKAGKKSGKSE
jgi:hypothetical protein